MGYSYTYIISLILTTISKLENLKSNRGENTVTMVCELYLNNAAFKKKHSFLQKNDSQTEDRLIHSNDRRLRTGLFTATIEG